MYDPYIYPYNSVTTGTSTNYTTLATTSYNNDYVVPVPVTVSVDTGTGSVTRLIQIYDRFQTNTSLITTEYTYYPWPWSVPPMIGTTPKFATSYVSDEVNAYPLHNRLYLKEKLKSNLMIYVNSRADLIQNIPKNERIAIESLREEITETEYRKYIKYGFILVKGKSSKVYQIFRNKSHTKVWKNGKVIEEICVRLKDKNIPPTDNVIAFKTMIETNEEEFKKLGNVYKMSA